MRGGCAASASWTARHVAQRREASRRPAAGSNVRAGYALRAAAACTVRSHEQPTREHGVLAAVVQYLEPKLAQW